MLCVIIIRESVGLLSDLSDVGWYGVKKYSDMSL